MHLYRLNFTYFSYHSSAVIKKRAWNILLILLFLLSDLPFTRKGEISRSKYSILTFQHLHCSKSFTRFCWRRHIFRSFLFLKSLRSNAPTIFNRKKFHCFFLKFRSLQLENTTSLPQNNIQSFHLRPNITRFQLLFFSRTATLWKLPEEDNINLFYTNVIPYLFTSPCKIHFLPALVSGIR